jgi:peptidyl-prolyl cis-trans isomerase A (cyclophilin A)
MPLLPRRLALVASLLAAVATACARPSPLLRPDRAERGTAPDTFAVRFETSKGPVTVEFYRAWAPRGVDRVYFLVQSGFYDDTRVFRVIPRFVAQFGAHGDPKVNAVWERRVIADDPIKVSNGRGTVAFAHAGTNTRTTQLFVNLANNARLDRLGFAPVGRVIDGLQRVDAMYGGYGDSPPRGRGPDQDRLAAEGNAYLQRSYPRLDYVTIAEVVRESRRR